MAKARHYLPCKTLLILYNTMIYPFLTYCNTIWASTYANRLQSSFRIQKKIVRIVTFSNLRDDSRPLFESLKILDIYKLNTYLTALFMYSYHHNKLPTFFNNFFITIKNIHSYNVPSKSKIHLEFRRTNYGQFSMRYREAIIWNNLPNDLKIINSYNHFKKSLKLYVQN